MQASGPGVFGANPYVSKSIVVGRIVAVLRGVSEHRGLQIEGYQSRAVPTGAIHELMSSNQSAGFGDTVDNVAIIAFFEVIVGGVILVGDVVEIAGCEIGSVLGFNDTHMPNHQNICLFVDHLRDGESLALRLDDPVRIVRR
jgi:hypothetical protein